MPDVIPLRTGPMAPSSIAAGTVERSCSAMLPRPLPRASTIWLGIIGGAAALDYWCDQGDPDQDTLSELIRRIYRTNTPTGRAAFAVSLVSGATWLHSHITKEI